LLSDFDRKTNLQVVFFIPGLVRSSLMTTCDRGAVLSQEVVFAF